MTMMHKDFTSVETVAPIQVQPKALDFDKIEMLRKHMMLNVGSMANLLETTRVSYYGWKKGAKLHKKNADRVRKLVRGMAHLAAERAWPTAEAYQVDQPTRVSMLKQALAKLEE